jgi:hypothetical protein
MNFEDFQKRRAFLSHTLLKNGVVMRLPEDSEQYVLRKQRRDSGPINVSATLSRPATITGNLHEAASTWLRGGNCSSDGVPKALQALLDAIPSILDFEPAFTSVQRAEATKRAADACSIVMEALDSGHLPVSEYEWTQFVTHLRFVVEAVDQMGAGHPEFDQWLISDLDAPCF